MRLSNKINRAHVRYGVWVDSSIFEYHDIDTEYDDNIALIWEEMETF